MIEILTYIVFIPFIAISGLISDTDKLEKENAKLEKHLVDKKVLKYEE